MPGFWLLRGSRALHSIFLPSQSRPLTTPRQWCGLVVLHVSQGREAWRESCADLEGTAVDKDRALSDTVDKDRGSVMSGQIPCIWRAATGEGEPTWGLTVFQEPTAEGARSFDPRDAWMLFIRQSEKGVNGKRGSRGKARKLKVSTRAPAVCVCVYVCISRAGGW